MNIQDDVEDDPEIEIIDVDQDDDVSSGSDTDQVDDDIGDEDEDVGSPDDDGDQPVDASTSGREIEPRLAEAIREVETIVEVMPRYDDELARIDQYARQLLNPIDLDPMNYSSDQEYQLAQAKEALRQTQIQQLASQFDGIAQQKEQAKLAIWERQSAIGKAKYKDFDNAISASSFQPSRAVAEAIVSTKHGADVAYHLAKNPKEAARLSRMTPLAAAIEIGRLSETLGKTAAAKKKQSAAPPVPPRLSGLKAPQGRTIEKMSISQLKKELYN